MIKTDIILIKTKCLINFSIIKIEKIIATAIINK